MPRFVEGDDEVLEVVLWRLGYRPERVEQKKQRLAFHSPSNRNNGYRNWKPDS